VSLGGARDIQHCTSASLASGINNITTAPDFIDRSGKNYRLILNSVLKNLGMRIDWHTSLFPFDLDGNSRIIGGSPDMGAYETGSNGIDSNGIRATTITDGVASITGGNVSGVGSINLSGMILGMTKQIWIIADVKVSGTNGGTFTNGAWQTRDLNTIEYNGGSDIILNANEITISTNGIYYISGRAPNSNVSFSQAEFYNVSDTTPVIRGTNNYSNTTAMQDSTFEGIITVSGAPKQYAVRHRCTNTRTDTGFGYPCGFGVDEIYTRIVIIRLD